MTRAVHVVGGRVKRCLAIHKPVFHLQRALCRSGGPGALALLFVDTACRDVLAIFLLCLKTEVTRVTLHLSKCETAHEMPHAMSLFTVRGAVGRIGADALAVVELADVRGSG